MMMDGTLTNTNTKLFRPVAQQGSWVSHVNGVENFLMQRGPVPLITELDNMLFFHARHSSVGHFDNYI
jgi:hypothetical protein